MEFVISLLSFFMQSTPKDKQLAKARALAAAASDFIKGHEELEEFIPPRARNYIQLSAINSARSIYSFYNRKTRGTIKRTGEADSRICSSSFDPSVYPFMCMCEL